MSLTALPKRLFFFLLCGMLVLAGSVAIHAQTRFNADSAARARQAALITTRAAQKHSLDSARAARQLALENLKAARQIRTDSLAAIRKHRESRFFRDSVKSAREDRIAAIRDAQHDRMDSLKDARTRITDSTIAAREAALAPVHKAQAKRMDSLTAIKKYKTGRRYADSVAIAQKARTQETAMRRKAFTDSLTARA